jgi:NADH-quinone oxidoreductase subunit F
LDLHLNEATASAAEKAAVDGCLGLPESGRPEAGSENRVAFSGQLTQARRHLLLPVLHAIQGQIGWISPGALNYACLRLDVPPAEAFGVASFYGLFSLTPRPPVVMHVCDDIACRLYGAEAVCERLQEKLGPPGKPDSDGRTTWLRSPCLGLCERAPAALRSSAGPNASEKVFAPTDADAVIAGLHPTDSTDSTHPDEFDVRVSIPQAGQPQLRLLRRMGRTDPESLDDYRANGGYDALRRALKVGRDRVVRELVDSRLRGRGGAAFPTGKKWDPANRPYYLVCNADESEPGTFKDRVIMEGDPFALVEAMTIAGFATGCEQGYLYIRGEYPLAFDRLVQAIGSCRNRGFLGEKILGHDFRFNIEMRRGAGAYICGEETALFNSIEGFRGEPRNKPPFPTQSGLFGRPTVVNNVETLINVLEIVLQGGDNYASIGTAASAGTKLFCLSGHVSRPGVYEVPFGATLRQLIDLGGGVAGSGRLQAILLGGAAGSFVSPEQLDTPLTFEGTRDIGATLGSGVVMLFDDQIDLKGILMRVAAFFRDESCGQCVPCRVGTVRQEELVRRLAGGKPAGSIEDELVLLREIGQVMRDASICGLGQTASSAIESAVDRLKIFRETE